MNSRPSDIFCVVTQRAFLIVGYRVINETDCYEGLRILSLN